MHYMPTGRVLPILAAFMGRRHNVDVRVGRGYTPAADVENGVIFLPALDPTDELSNIMINGYIDHESAHIRWTTPGAMRKASSISPLHGNMYNIFEDIRIEKMLGQALPGCKENLNKLVEALLKRQEIGQEDLTDPLSVFVSTIWNNLRLKVLGNRCLATVATKRMLAFHQLFPGVWDKLEAFIYTIDGAPTSEDSINLAIRVIDLLKQEMVTPPPMSGSGGQDDQDQQQSDPDQNQNDSSDGDGDGDDSDGSDKSGSQGKDSKNKPSKNDDSNDEGSDGKSKESDSKKSSSGKDVQDDDDDAGDGGDDADKGDKDGDDKASGSKGDDEDDSDDIGDGGDDADKGDKDGDDKASGSKGDDEDDSDDIGDGGGGSDSNTEEKEGDEDGNGSSGSNDDAQDDDDDAGDGGDDADKGDKDGDDKASGSKGDDEDDSDDTGDGGGGSDSNTEEKEGDEDGNGSSGSNNDAQDDDDDAGDGGDDADKGDKDGKGDEADGDEEGDSDDTADGDSGSDSDADGENAGSDEKDGQGDQDGNDAGDGAGSDGSGGDAQASGSDAGQCVSEGDGQSDMDSGNSDQQGGGAGAEGTKRANIQKVLDATENELPEDVIEAVKRTLEKKAGEVQGDYSKIHEVLVIGEDRKDPIRLFPIDKAAVVSETNALIYRLQSMVQSRQQRHEWPSRSSCRMTRRNLHRARVQDDRLFIRKNEVVKVNTAVHILLDASGSMGRDKMPVALNATLAAGLALESIPGVSLGITAFPDNGDDVLPIVQHGQRINPQRFALDSDGGTPLTAALMNVGKKLLTQQHPRKLCFVVTDGEPHGPESARLVVDQFKLLGIECFGIGIKTMKYPGLFDEFRVIMNVQELPDAMFGMLQERLFDNQAQLRA